jgi:hypothetical protein
MTPGEAGGKGSTMNFKPLRSATNDFFVSPPSGLKEIFITPTPGFTRGHHSVASSRHVGNTDKFNPKNISRLNGVTYFEF